MGFTAGMIIVGIITLGIYKLFELFVCKKERMMIIERMGDKLGSVMVNANFKYSTSSLPFSFSALKVGSLLLGVGLGLIIGYFICINTIPNYLIMDDHRWKMDEFALLIYGACSLLFGGLGLLLAFIVELKLSRKHEQQ